jgi:hypothetical protein
MRVSVGAFSVRRVELSLGGPGAAIRKGEKEREIDHFDTHAHEESDTHISQFPITFISYSPHSIHRLEQEDQYLRSRSHSKFTKPHLPHLLLHPPDPFHQDEEDVVGSSSNNSTASTPASLARLPPFSSFENPLRFKFPAVRSPPPRDIGIVGRRTSPPFAPPPAPPPAFLPRPPALSQRSSGSTVHSRQSETGSSGTQSRSSSQHVSVARRTIRPDLYSSSSSSKSSSGNHHVNTQPHTTTPAQHQNSLKHSPRNLFTRTELKIGSSPPIVHPRLGESSRSSASSSALLSTSPSGSKPTRSRKQESNLLLPPITRGFLPERDDRFLPTPTTSTTSTTNSPRSSSPSLHRTTTTRSLYHNHASASPFVTRRPRLLQQRNSVSDIKMSQSISPDHPRSGSPTNTQREETPTPTLVKREMAQDAYEANEAKERKQTRASESGPVRTEAEAEEARDGLGKGPDFDFTARRHSLATTAFISPNGNGMGNGGGANALEPIRVSGGAYHNTNAPAHPSPLGLGANPVNANTATSGLTPRTVSGSTTGVSAIGPPGPGSAGFRKRKESHDRAAGYIESGHEPGMPGTQAPPALPAPSHLASLHLQPPHHSSSSSSNPASTTSHNNVFQVPAPPVFSNPFGQHPSSSSTSIDRLEPPAKRRGSTYDSRMSHLSIAPTGSPPIGPSGEGPGGPGGIPGTALPANSWWNQQPDRRDSTASMYSNRSLASSTGGYGSSNTSYSIMSEKGGYAPPSYSESRWCTNQEETSVKTNDGMC